MPIGKVNNGIKEKAWNNDRNKDRNRIDAKRSLIALTSSAMALPNLPQLTNTAEAAMAPEPSVALQLSHYTEADLDSADVRTDLGGALSRYEIPAFIFKAQMPYNDHLAFTLDFAFEKMSGASPWYIAPAVDGSNILYDASGKPIPKVRMSGATIEDERTDIGLTTHYYLPRVSIDGTVRLSTEDDYQAVTGALGVAVESEDKMRTFETSMSVSGDTIEAVDVDLYQTRPNGKKRKASFSVYSGFTQVLSRVSTFQTGIGFKMHSGYLTDPYKEVYFYGGSTSNVHEFRPSDRIMTTWVARYRRHFEGPGSSWHLDYRLFTDNWGVNSHTIDTAWYQDIGDTFQIVPSIRYYTQTDADFYDALFAGDPSDYNYYSSDYRLSSFGALTFGLKFIKKFSKTTLHLDVEAYDSDASLGIGDAVDSPALVDFYTVSFGLKTQY